MKKILQSPLCRKLSFLLIAAFAFMASGCSPMMYDDHPHFSHHRYDPPGHKPKPPKPGHHKPKPPKPGHKPKPPKPGHNNQKPPKPGHNNQKPSKPGHNNHR